MVHAPALEAIEGMVAQLERTLSPRHRELLVAVAVARESVTLLLARRDFAPNLLPLLGGVIADVRACLADEGRTLDGAAVDELSRAREQLAQDIGRARTNTLQVPYMCSVRGDPGSERDGEDGVAVALVQVPMNRLETRVRRLAGPAFALPVALRRRLAP